MSFQQTFDIIYYYYHYCYCKFIHCCQKNDSHNLENKKLINSLQPGVAYLYALKNQNPLGFLMFSRSIDKQAVLG